MYHGIHFNLILPKIRALSIEHVFEALAQEIAPRTYCSKNAVLDTLRQNELKAASGVGGGVAIPHIQMSGIATRFVTLATLERPVDFQAADDVDADIICVLLSPESDGSIHLRGLSRITRMLQNEQLQRRLRETDDIDIIRALITNPDGWLLAA